MLSCVRSRLLDVSVIVLLLSIVAAFAVPKLVEALRESRARAVAADLRAFAAAFQAYARERGDWPAAATGAHVDPRRWAARTPIGGHYAWAPNSLHQGARYHAALVFGSTPETQVSADARQLRAIDRLIDDGDLATGNFHLGYRNVPVFVIEH